VPFTTVEEAVAGATRILGEYATHAEAARAVAETSFDSDMVLARFLDDCDAS
jgi:hypothetical protein